MFISSQFDAGAIEVIAASDPSNIQLNIRADNAAQFRQWFYFRVHDVANTELTLHLLNAGEQRDYTDPPPDADIAGSRQRNQRQSDNNAYYTISTANVRVHPISPVYAYAVILVHKQDKKVFNWIVFSC